MKDENRRTADRIEYLEFLRVFAMFCVILIHICITAVTDFAEHSYGTTGGVLYYSVRNICHFAVPAFFMISGALFLQKDKEISLEKLFKKYVIKYLLVIVVFGWGFALAEEVFSHHNVSPYYFVTSFVNMVSGKTWNHMWYMYELVGIMLFLPVTKLIINYMDRKEQKYVGILCFVFLSVFPLIKSVFGISVGISFPVSSVYLFYLMLGYWLSQRRIEFKKSIYLLCVIISAALCVLDAYFFMIKDKNLGLASYNSPFIVILSVAVFGLFMDGDYKSPAATRCRGIISFLSAHSFSVYIIHMFYINMIYKVVKIDPFSINALLGMLVLWAAVSILSVVSAAVMKKIPYLKNII